MTNVERSEIPIAREKIKNKKIFKLMKESTKYQIDLDKRLLSFAVKTIKFLQTIPYKKEFDVFRYQLSKPATSIGANLPCGIKK